MVMALFPKFGDAWEVGLHQCSHDRIWTLDALMVQSEKMLSIGGMAAGMAHENLVQLMEKTISLAKNEYDLKKKFDAKQMDIKMETAQGFPLASSYL